MDEYFDFKQRTEEVFVNTHFDEAIDGFLNGFGLERCQDKLQLVAIEQRAFVAINSVHLLVKDQMSGKILPQHVDYFLGVIHKSLDLPEVTKESLAAFAQSETETRRSLMDTLSTQQGYQETKVDPGILVRIHGRLNNVSQKTMSTLKS